VRLWQPLLKRVSTSTVMRGLGKLPRRNDPRGITLLVRASHTHCRHFACVLCSLTLLPCTHARSGLGEQVPPVGGA
jgi:hypothetical protein